MLAAPPAAVPIDRNIEYGVKAAPEPGAIKKNSALTNTKPQQPVFGNNQRRRISASDHIGIGVHFRGPIAEIDNDVLLEFSALA